MEYIIPVVLNSRHHIAHLESTARVIGCSYASTIDKAMVWVQTVDTGDRKFARHFHMVSAGLEFEPFTVRDDGIHDWRYIGVIQTNLGVFLHVFEESQGSR